MFIVACLQQQDQYAYKSVIFRPPQQGPILFFCLPFPLLFFCKPSSHLFPSLLLALISSSSLCLPCLHPPPHPSRSLVSLCSLCYRCFSSRRLYCLVPVFYHGANKLPGRNHQVNAAPPEAISVRSIAAFSAPLPRLHPSLPPPLLPKRVVKQTDELLPPHQQTVDL